MYCLYKDDLYGNKVPVMVAEEKTATKLLRDKQMGITRVVECASYKMPTILM